MWLYATLGYLLVVVGFRWSTREAKLDRETLGIIAFQVGAALAVYNGGWYVSPAMEAALAVFLAGWTYVALIRGPKFRPVDLRGRVAMVTGANTGIGLETARELARMGATVVLACRTPAKAERAVDDIKRSTGNSNISWMKVDFLSLASVRALAAEFKRSGRGLDILINNAGMMRSDRRVSPDGLEHTLQVNLLGTFLLTQLLLSELRKRPGSRIVLVNSSLHNLPPSLDFSDVQLERNYEMFTQYSRTKLAGVLYCKELSRRLKAQGASVTVNCLHPGQVMTEVTRNMHWFLRYGEKLFHPVSYLLRKTPSQGAYTSVFAATAPSLNGISGRYFVHCRDVPPNPASDDANAARRVWDMCEELTGLSSRSVSGPVTRSKSKKKTKRDSKKRK